ncbi:unnamed protein product [Effrenium voratum]|uniref:Uncharacterized protein n=1 Tax=Effrenium voratum TaxID=2562239 RepID=A0AA36J5I6_9DINO|nr:unnamed protein product [Effrenium voratum]CAJ1398904.1 unnamed protein product [Effrenium voratum]CAJ1450402.1 unnamed protein product [Effrenium voratum]
MLEMSAVPSQREPRQELLEEEDVQLKVSWGVVGGACEELIEYEVGSFVSVADARRPCSALFFRRMICGCRCWSKEPEVETLMRCYLWKLNSNVELTSDRLSDLSNWRRRLFFLQRKSTTVVITYLSEKGNGVVQLACKLSGGRLCLRHHCEARRLPKVKVELGTDKREDMLDSMRQYDVAFSRKVDGTYEKLLPASLQASCFSWRDQTLVMAARPELARAFEKAVVLAVPELASSLAPESG